MDQMTNDAIELTASLPTFLRVPLRQIVKDPQMNGELRELMGRGECDPLTSLLAGVGMNPDAKMLMDERMDEHWARRRLPPKAGLRRQEVIIGAGLHAAVYAATRRSLGYPAPVVLEETDRVGGAFYMSRGPSFYLNSRNRPGDLSYPGDLSGALNVIPGAPLQPAHMSGEEYQTNDVMAWVIRLTLAMHADVVCNQRATGVASINSGGRATINGLYLVSKRMILASGLGKPKDISELHDKSEGRILYFNEFMKMMDSDFPLKGMKRVAVIGDGDSGKTAIEALTGQGPRMFSSAALDYPTKIDWYGVAVNATCATWKQTQRSRYARIGGLLPRSEGSESRVRPAGPASDFSLGYDCVMIGERKYDHVIDCTGYIFSPLVASLEEPALIGNRAVGRTLGNLYAIGPAARLLFSPTEENTYPATNENNVASFRYASKTAALAASLNDRPF